MVAARHDRRDPRVGEDLVAFDVATGDARVLTHGDAWYDAPGRLARTGAAWPRSASRAAARRRPSEPRSCSSTWPPASSGRSPRTWIAGRSSRSGRPTAGALFFTADDDGHLAVYRVELGGAADGRVTRLTADGAYSDLCPSPDGVALYALRSTHRVPAADRAAGCARGGPGPDRAGPLDRRGRDRRRPASSSG